MPSISNVTNSNFSVNNQLPLINTENSSSKATTTTNNTVSNNQVADPNRDSRLNSQFLRSRNSIGSTAVQEMLKAATTLKRLPKPVAQPELRQEHQDAQKNDATLYQYKSVEGGKLIIDDVSATDVIQGRIADCYLVASLAAVAHTDPNYIKKGIRDNGNGTYTVKLYNYDYSTGKYRAKSITVDDKFPMRADGKTPLYGRSAATKEGGMELWVAILEKAIAASNGGYDDIGEGGSASAVFEQVTGKRSQFYSTTTMSFETLKRQVNAGHPVVAATRGKEAEPLYKDTNIYPWHAYTVMGVEEKDGQQFVKIRNPWGNTEPGNDGVNDGIFTLSYQDFKKFYLNVYVSQA